jgi:hypothetical protein
MVCAGSARSGLATTNKKLSFLIIAHPHTTHHGTLFLFRCAPPYFHSPPTLVTSPSSTYRTQRFYLNVIHPFSLMLRLSLFLYHRERCHGLFSIFISKFIFNFPLVFPPYTITDKAALNWIGTCSLSTTPITFGFYIYSTSHIFSLCQIHPTARTGSRHGQKDQNSD